MKSLSKKQAIQFANHLMDAYDVFKASLEETEHKSGHKYTSEDISSIVRDQSMVWIAHSTIETMYPYCTPEQKREFELGVILELKRERTK